MLQYYFYKKGTHKLAPILASCEEEAAVKLPMIHNWVDATPENSTLIKVSGNNN